MEHLTISTLIPVILSILNSIGMVCLYLRHVKALSNAIMAIRVTDDGEVEIMDLLPFRVP